MKWKWFILIIILMIFAGCSKEWYLIKEVTLSPKDVNQAFTVVDTNRAGIENIRAIQKMTECKQPDFWWGTAMAVTEGIGLGLYESKVYYSPNAFPSLEGTFVHDWVNMKTGGDYWLKIGHPDKVGRAMWISSTKASWNRYLKFYGGNWVYAYLTQFTISNTVATLIRQQAKHGNFAIFEVSIFDWRIIEALFD